MKIAAAVLMVLGLTIVVTFLMSYPVYLLWNGCLVAAVTIAKPISWTQAWGLTLLFGILVRSGDAKVEAK